MRTIIVLIIFAVVLTCNAVSISGAVNENSSEKKRSGFVVSFDELKKRFDAKPLPEVIQDAEKGDTLAAAYVGRVYFDGTRTNRDDKVAVSWFRKAAEDGLANAENNLGLCYYNGWGVEMDLEQAQKWLRRSGEHGFVTAFSNLGQTFVDSHGHGTNVVEAIKWYEVGAGAGDLESSANLGWIYSTGFAGKTNYSEALRWLKPAVEKHHARSEFLLARMYLFAEGVERDATYGKQLLLSASEQNNRDAQNELGWQYELERKYDLAEEWYKKAAAQKHPYAQYHLGDLCKYGHLGDARRADADSWYLLAAEQGCVPAMSRLGRSETFPQSWDWFRKAAEHGDIDAQFAMAERYRFGQGSLNDPKQAVYWYSKVGQQDPNRNSKVADALFRLARMVENGEGTNRDQAVANQLYLSAGYAGSAEGGYKAATLLEKGEGVPLDEALALELYISSATRGLGEFQDKAAEAAIKLMARNPDAVQPYRYAFPMRKSLQKMAQFIVSPDAMFAFGEIYFRGIGVDRDLAFASYWFTKAAQKNDPDAENRVGEMWHAGSSGKRDDSEAVKWFLKASLHGSAMAKLNLGRQYLKGDGVEKNATEALAYFILASKSGVTAASEERDNLKKSLSPEQIKLADERADSMSQTK